MEARFQAEASGNRQFGRSAGTQTGGRPAGSLEPSNNQRKNRTGFFTCFLARPPHEYSVFMSRKTYSLSAVALIATVSFSFSSADGSEAFAQAGPNDLVVEAAGLPDELIDLSDDAFEIVPIDDIAQSDVKFVSKAVVQELPEDADLRAPLADGSLSELVSSLQTEQLTDQLQCLAGAVYFEARGEPLSGQLAVAQVVINRSEDPRWPTSYCGVVYQRAQFSFVKNGRMPTVRTSSDAWQRAKAVAQIAHQGLWESQARDAVYFHANYVRPKWSRRKERLAQIDTHIFYR